MESNVVPALTTGQLQLADVVFDVNQPSLGVMAVREVTESHVEFFRPYPSPGDFAVMGCGVICYIGIETFKIPRGERMREWILVSRKELR